MGGRAGSETFDPRPVRRAAYTGGRGPSSRHPRCLPAKSRGHPSGRPVPWLRDWTGADAHLSSSVSVHILPDLLHTFSQRHPNITFELLQGSYEDIERWLSEGRIDLGFLRLPTNSHFRCTLLLEERILAIFPEDQAPEEDTFPVEALKQAPYILRPDSLDNETREIFRKTLCNPRITYSAKDDYAVMAMVERGLGISILPELLLKRTPYRLAKRELSPPATRQIGVACKNPQALPPAARQFLHHIKQAAPL
ncbi:MAG: LysR family transcriptional regulator substrate-binding protein [Evtepia gabavorous]